MTFTASSLLPGKTGTKIEDPTLESSGGEDPTLESSGGYERGGEYVSTTTKDAVQRVGRRPRGQNSGAVSDGSGGAIQDPYDSKSDVTTKEWVDAPDKSDEQGPFGENAGGIGDIRDLLSGYKPDSDAPVFYDQTSSSTGSLLDGTFQATDYTGSSSGGGYSTLISPTQSPDGFSGDSYDFEKSSRVQRNDLMSKD